MAKNTTLEELGQMLSHVVEHMATKEDLEKLATKEELNEFRAEFREFRNYTIEELRTIRSELADIRRDLESLKERVGDMSGYSKEIDHLLERVRAIEQHLGIKPRVAA